MKVANPKKMMGFTLVEMLVVIAIIAILASALFPAIQNAMGQAQATAMKNKGRGIWVAINSANMEREPLNLGTVWPKDLIPQSGDSEQDKSKVTINPSTPAYFTYLMSEGGSDSKGQIADNTEDQVVSDLSVSSLIASGVTPANGKSIGADNVAWKVCEVGDTTAAEIPFLFSRNLDESTLRFAEISDTMKLKLKDIKPFGTKRAVWVTRGGGVFDARHKYLTFHQVMGDPTSQDSGEGDEKADKDLKVWQNE